MPNTVYDEYTRLGSPEYAQSEIARRLKFMNPEIQRMLSSVRANLNQRGLFSASPVTRAEYRTRGDITNQVSSDVYQGINERRMRLLELIARIEEAEKARRAQRQSGLFGGLGRIFGTIGGHLLNRFLPLPLPNYGGNGDNGMPVDLTET